MTKTLAQHFTLSKVLIGAVIMGVLALVAYNVRDIVLGTQLTVTAAADGATLDDTFLPLTGVARHARKVFINGRTISIDRNGKFTDAIILSPGYNIVEVAQRDRFGKTETRTYHWVVEPVSVVATGTSAQYR